VASGFSRITPHQTRGGTLLFDPRAYFGGAGAGTVVAGSGQLPSYGGQFGTASPGAG
jgi:hypothetical protein